LTEPEAPLLEGLGDAAGMPIGAPEGGEVQIIASGWHLALREFFDNKLAVVGLAVIVFFILFCFIGPLFDSTNQSLTGLAIGSLAIGVLGVLMITGEYSSGTIRSSLAATPRRPLLLGAKVAVIGAISVVVGEILTFACFFTGRAILSGRVQVATLGQPGVLRALLLSGAFLALLGMFGLGLGVIIRNTAGAIAAYVGVIFLLPVLLQTLNGDGNPGRFAPLSILANSVAAVIPQSGQLSATTGFLFMVLYCALALGIGVAVLSRRDA